jgi:trk system potassium uptake protein TrkH
MSRNHINYRSVVRILGMLSLVEGAFMLIPLAVSLAYGEPDANAFIISIIIVAALGSAAMWLSKPRHHEFGRREGILLTSVVWIVFSFFGMLPFLFSSLNLNIASAYFEAMSGFTTTGASVLGDITDMPYGIHVWRCLMQWVGGVGIIIFTVALLPMFNSSGGMQMFFAESSGSTYDKLRPRVSQTAKRLWLIYSGLTVACFLLLWAGEMPLFDSICHAMSTVSTGGFSMPNDSLNASSSDYTKIIVLIFMFIGGVNFGLLYRTSIGKLRSVWRDEVLRAYTRIVLFVTLIFAVIIFVKGAYSGIDDLIISPLFQVVTTITSTGFCVSDFSSWGPTVFPFLFMLMFIGACAGSTTGGAKIDRVLYLWKNCCNEIKRSSHPNRYYPLSINGRTSQPEMLSKILAFIFLFLVLIMVGALLLSVVGVPLGDSFFASASCMGNTGLGAGVTASSYSVIPDFGKWVLSTLMLLGRLEIFTVITLLTVGFWRK